jgi:hypothetical protein
MMASGRSILVTGSHRSGTTWCGRVLASQPGVLYIQEPFHLLHTPGSAPVRFRRWFQYVGSHNEEKFAPALRRTASLRFSLGAHIGSILRSEHEHFHRRLRGIAWAIREWARWTRARWSEARPLLKDPIALFSAGWIAKRFDAQVIITVRHPAAFAHSLQRAGWTHDFSSFTEQPALMEGVLAPFADEIQRADDEPGDIIDQAILLWKVMHHVIDEYRERHPEWQVVRNEDLAVYPMQSYRALCDYLDLPFDAAMEKTVELFTTAGDRHSGDMPLHAVRRDSEAEAWKWRRELDAETISRVRKGTTPVWKKFYSSNEW